MKSYDQTWLGRTAGRLQIACAAVPPAFLPEARLRRGGTRCPSSRQSRSIRLRFTRQPSSRSSDQIRRYPQRGCAAASSFIRATSRSS